MDEAANWASKAVEFDRQGKFDAAIYFYSEAARSILLGIASGILPAAIKSTAEGYISRGEQLKELQSQDALKDRVKSKQQLDLERAEFLLHQAFDEDEAKNHDEAIDLYSESISLCLDTRKATQNAELQKKLAQLAELALERAETLKASRKGKTSKQPAVVDSVRNQFDYLSVGGEDDTKRRAAANSPKLSRTVGGSDVGLGGYSKEELEVLRTTSVINGREYVPFMSVDLKEKFAYPVPFSDKCGKLALAQKQSQRFVKWVRPDEIIDSPHVINKINSASIKQTIVSDCSFIASLAIAARYEQRFNRRLITDVIYPQNKRGEPVYNPCGKYMIKFHLNGVARKVIIDDLLPMGKYGELLCSFSNNREELWVSLLEKAYMKIMGGYDFPGSNSNIDLHALTGWIPERIAIRPNSPEFNRDAIFEKLFKRYHVGDCLITVATGKMTDAEADRAGLVDCHAYAMLDVRKVGDRRLFLLKNPWNHLRWKGRYSERDATNWTAELKKALAYDPQSAQSFDDGEFWIDLESIVQFFDVFYISWNPSLFSQSYAIHAKWSAGVGPTKDLYSLGDNPQYRLEVNNQVASAAVWILLTRHITDKADFENNREYITVLVYKNDGQKVYYPTDPPPYIDGNRINSPHYLCKMLLTGVGVSKFTLVVSQYEKMNTIYYTLRVYSTCPFKLDKIQDTYKHRKRETGEWKGITAGGCANCRETYKNNPVYQLSLDSPYDDNQLYVDLRGPKQYSVGFDMVQVTSSRNKTFERTSSGAFRPGMCVKTFDAVPAGVYNITVATFLAGQESAFFLNIQSSCPFTISRL